MPERRKRDLDDAEIVWVCCVGGVGMVGFVTLGSTERCGEKKKKKDPTGLENEQTH